MGDSKKIKNSELVELKNSLLAARKLTGDNEVKNRAKFFYAVNKNIDKIDSELSVIEKMVELADDFKAFDKDRVEKLSLYAKKDENGNPLIVNDVNPVNGQQVQKYEIEDEEGWAKEFKKLEENHKVALDNRKKQMEDYISFMNEYNDIELFSITMDYLPNDCDGELMSSLRVILSDY